MRGLWLKAKFAFDHRHLRERILISVGLVAIFIVCWFVFLLKPLQAGLAPMREGITTAQGLTAQFKAQYTKTKNDIKAIKKPNFDKQINELNERIARLQKQTEEVSTRVVNKKQISRLLNAILDRSEGVKLILFDALKAKALSGAQGGPEHTLYKNSLAIELTGTYYQLLAFLEKIENLGINIYWQNIAVNVGKYPATSIKLKLFILSRQAGVLGEIDEEQLG